MSESMPPPLPPTQGALLWTMCELTTVSEPRLTMMPPPSPSPSVLSEKPPRIVSRSSVVLEAMSKTRSMPLASIVAVPRPVWTILSLPEVMSRSPLADLSSPVLGIEST